MPPDVAGVYSNVDSDCVIIRLVGWVGTVCSWSCFMEDFLWAKVDEKE